MASGLGVVEHYECVCECAWQQRVRPLTPDLPPILETPCLKIHAPHVHARPARAAITPAWYQ